jgi:N-methylhydantoinase A/oxoprolinase/acetone carboxylase beta subunit
MQSNSGIASGREVVRRAVYALGSGPAAGPAAGLFHSRQFGEENILTVDMGGTSCDVCLVRDGKPDVVKGVDVHRYRLGVPMIDVNAVGAGGGSIAQVDGGGMLQVGPQSAGANPGPACYGRGGTEATVTDANVVLGYLDGSRTLAPGFHDMPSQRWLKIYGRAPGARYRSAVKSWLRVGLLQTKRLARSNNSFGSWHAPRKWRPARQRRAHKARQPP